MSHPRIGQLAHGFGLTDVEVAVIEALAAIEGAVDRDPADAITIAALATGLARPRAPGAPDPVLAAIAPGGHLVNHGLIELGGHGPLPGRIVRLPDTVAARLLGLSGDLPFPVAPRGWAELSTLVLAPTTRAQVDEVVAYARRAAGLPLVVLIGSAARSPDALAAALANELGCTAMFVAAVVVDSSARLIELRREARWLGAAVVIQGAPSAESLSRLALEIAAPIVVITETGLAAEACAAPGRWRLDVELDALPRAERAQAWRRHLGESPVAPDVDVGVLADQLAFDSARIAAIAAHAHHQAAARGSAVTAADLRRAARRASPTNALARCLAPDRRLDDLVVPTATRRELELACAWARCGGSALRGAATRRALRDATGLVCLFFGPPGTGKTLAAHAIAGELGLDLLRIDLSQVVNKYIGETEKNLARVFDEAEAAGAVLFFDEADALFGKRSDVKDAHDRYANIETAFLLQRLEAHGGVSILASNLRHNLDEAFTRRIQVAAEFPLPGPDERIEIWDRHLARDALAPDVDLAALGRRFAIAGGDIRNAAATALVLATAESTAPAMRHLVIGVWRELRKVGRLVGADDFGPWRDVISDYVRG